MGDEVVVTALHMTAAMATIANGGKLIMPRVVKSISTSGGKVISSLSPVVVRQVISRETAREIADARRGVVREQGAACAGAVPGWTDARTRGDGQDGCARGA